MSVEEHPRFFCLYYNEDDDRSCICWGYDECKCNKPSCAPNLATTAGKIFALMYIAAAILILTMPLYIKF